MGYTHYWDSVDFTCDEWQRIKKAARLITNRSLVIVQYEDDDKRPPQIDDKMIRFNGVGDEGHETFLIKHTKNEWSFCKTARKDYDEIVVAVLIAISIICPRFNWRSDGYPDDHAEGVALYNKALPGMDVTVNAGWQKGLPKES